MEESLTQGVPQEVAPVTTEQTTQPVETPTADGNQETISSAPVQETVSTTTAEVNNEGGEAETDDGLAKFAKGQGYSDEDIAGMSEREKKTLLSLKKNVDAYRNRPEKGLTDVSTDVDAPKPNESEDESFKREFRAYKYERQVDRFWDTGKDRSLEPVMADILNEKVAELTPSIGETEAKKYAFNLSRDLGTLYNLAQIKSGSFDPQAAKEEGRREAVDSIRRQSSASAPEAHATTPVTSAPKVDRNWLANEYDPSNEEHRKLLAEAMARGDLY